MHLCKSGPLISATDSGRVGSKRIDLSYPLALRVIDARLRDGRGPVWAAILLVSAAISHPTREILARNHISSIQN